MEAVELDEVQWCSPEWVNTFGLFTGNVLEYFAQSPFYDRSSNNQILKMQSNFNEQLQGRRESIENDLKNMKGIEFQVLIAREPNLWVIVKQDRKTPTVTEVLAVYFVSGQNIFQSSSIYNILSSRILATSKFLYDALKSAEKLPKFQASGYYYDTNMGSKLAGEDKPKVESDDIESQNEPNEENVDQEESDSVDNEGNPLLDARYLNSSLDATLLQLRNNNQPKL